MLEIAEREAVRAERGKYIVIRGHLVIWCENVECSAKGQAVLNG